MGQGVEIDANNCIVNKNPATGEVISRVPCTPIEELDQMVAKAKDALPSWSAMDVHDRIELLKKGLDVLKKDSEKLKELITKEMGKPRGSYNLPFFVVFL